MRIDTFLRVLLLMVLLLSIVFPAALQGAKIALLALIVGFILILVLKNPSQMRWSKSVLITSLFFSFIGFTWSLYGETMGNPGAMRVITVMGIYPLILTFLGCFWKPGDAARLQKAFLWFGFILIVSQFLYIGSSFGLDGGVFKSLYGDVAVVDQGEDYFLFTLPSVASLIFFLPFYFVGFIFDSKFNIRYLFLFLSAVVIVLLSGRRAIYLSFGTSLLLTFCIIAVGCLFLPKRTPKFSGVRVIYFVLGIAAFIALLLTIGVQNKDLIYSDMKSIFDFTSGHSNLERAYQYVALKEGISNNFLCGSGAGAVASYTRSHDQPWAYELFYVSIIFQYGFIVFLIYLCGVLFLICKQLCFIFNQRINKESKLFLLCFFAGFVSFFVAAATNPYIAKFDYMWIIFIPVVMINSFRITNEI